MTGNSQSRSGVTRRDAIVGLGAAAAATTMALPGRAAGLAPSVGSLPAALGPTVPGLTYVGIDAYQFLPEKPQDRIYQTITGSQGPVNQRIFAGLPLPSGSQVLQINVGYQGQPIVEIGRRRLMQPNPAIEPTKEFQKTLAASPGGPFSSTENLPTPVTIESDSTYTLSFFLTAGASVFGATIGYLPPTQGFIPFTGTPRVLDTRGGAKLAPDEERIVDLGIPGARTAVINLTVTQTVDGGFVAVFPTGIPWPGNSSINWTRTNQDVANGVTTAVDASGRITIRGGNNPTHVIVDRIGYLL